MGLNEMTNLGWVYNVLLNVFVINLTFKGVIWLLVVNLSFRLLLVALHSSVSTQLNLKHSKVTQTFGQTQATRARWRRCSYF